MSQAPLLPGSTGVNQQPITVGVMGGGQLGRMFVQAAQAMGYFTAVLDPDAQSRCIFHTHLTFAVIAHACSFQNARQQSFR